MNDHPGRPIAAAICCLALAWTSASAAGESMRSPSAVDRTAAATGAGGQPTAGGNSAQPEKTEKGSGAVGPTTGHDDRTVPSPATGRPLPTQGGNSAESDKTGASRGGLTGVDRRKAKTGSTSDPTRTAPTAGGNSAEPDKTGKGKAGESR